METGSQLKWSWLPVFVWLGVKVIFYFDLDNFCKLNWNNFVYWPSQNQLNIISLSLTLTHKKLFFDVSSGNEQAFESLYNLYFPRLYAFSLKIIGDQGLAKDIVQNVFIKLWENHASLKHENPEAYLYRMVRNASLNYIRHLKVVDKLNMNWKDQMLGEELYYIDMVGDEPYVLIARELQDEVIRVLDSLPDKCRQVFKMSRIEGKKNQEIAEYLNVSIKTVEKHISKALSIYRTHFSDYLPMHLLLLILSGIE
ncbi:RNA polymerase sigma-70 factor [uncultured Sunxiuqinia sp.]|uniref:RNA polymerase sigma-70 factor n=1 Tax=uncultured Sunxiuqinia sp. TaxID=1573825 RepID=UPI00260FA298|nr:RNA polymerase sigma-70 factor [uncultured Sunxiuqinia sp.]